jgi:hypothetical protein
VIARVTGKVDKTHAEAHDRLLQIARNAAAKTRRKNSIVSVAPELDAMSHEDAARPPVPAGRKSLKVVN